MVFHQIYLKSFEKLNIVEKFLFMRHGSHFHHMAHELNEYKKYKGVPIVIYIHKNYPTHCPLCKISPLDFTNHHTFHTNNMSCVNTIFPLDTTLT